LAQKLQGAAGKLGRWSKSLADYDLEFEHIPGKDNVVSDALSRVRVSAVGADLEEWQDATSKDEKIQDCFQGPISMSEMVL
jgi:hypothetical protein